MHAVYVLLFIGAALVGAFIVMFAVGAVIGLVGLVRDGLRAMFGSRATKEVVIESGPVARPAYAYSTVPSSAYAAAGAD